MDFFSWQQKIKKWAHERDIIEQESVVGQFMKLVEEIAELGQAINRNDRTDIADGIGDSLVVLTVIAESLALGLADCGDFAYEQIKNRKGKMVDGIFVKEKKQ